MHLLELSSINSRIVRIFINLCIGFVDKSTGKNYPAWKAEVNAYFC